MARLLLSRQSLAWLNVLLYLRKLDRAKKSEYARAQRMVRGNTMKNARKIRQQLLEINPHCHWCGAGLTLDTSTLEHIIPASFGAVYGRDRKNLALACNSQINDCNNKRGNRVKGFVKLAPEQQQKLKQLKEQLTGV